MKNRTQEALIILLALAWAIALSPAALAQTFKKVNVQHKAKMAQISSGGASVWGLDTNGHPYLYKGTSFVQQSTNSYAQIAAGGGNVRQPDTVWALDAAGNIYNVVKSGTTYVFNQKPGVLDFIVVGIGYQDGCHPYEVWGLNTSSEIWRFNFCASNWDQEPGNLCAIQVGGGDVWGTDCNGDVFAFDYATQRFRQYPFRVLQVAVEPQGAWILAQDSGQTYVSQITGNSDLVRSCCLASSLVQIQAGDGVWVIDTSGEVYVLRFAQGFEFVQIPGILLASISVGSGGGVWGIGFNGQVYAFSTP